MIYSVLNYNSVIGENAKPSGDKINTGKIYNNADWESSITRTNGFTRGETDSASFNTAIKQVSYVNYLFSEFISRKYAQFMSTMLFGVFTSYDTYINHVADKFSKGNILGANSVFTEKIEDGTVSDASFDTQTIVNANLLNSICENTNRVTEQLNKDVQFDTTSTSQELVSTYDVNELANSLIANISDNTIDYMMGSTKVGEINLKIYKLQGSIGSIRYIGTLTFDITSSITVLGGDTKNFSIPLNVNMGVSSFGMSLYAYPTSMIPGPSGTIYGGGNIQVNITTTNNESTANIMLYNWITNVGTTKFILSDL